MYVSLQRTEENVIPPHFLETDFSSNLELVVLTTLPVQGTSGVLLLLFPSVRVTNTCAHARLLHEY